LEELIVDIDKKMKDAKVAPGSASLLLAPLGINRASLALLQLHYDSWLKIEIFEDATSHTLYLDFIEKPRKIARKAKV